MTVCHFKNKPKRKKKKGKKERGERVGACAGGMVGCEIYHYNPKAVL